MEIDLAWTEGGKKRTGKAIFDDDFPHVDAKWQPQGKYLRASLGRDHPLAAGEKIKSRVYAHRAVVYWKLGPGPHDCGICGWGGLRWDADRVKEGDEFLAVDHLKHKNGVFDNRAEALRPSCDWCNNNRPTLDELGIPYDHFSMLPPSMRPALRMKFGGRPTPIAESIIADIANATEAEQRAVEAAKTWAAREEIPVGEGHPDLTEAAASPVVAMVLQGVEEGNAEAEADATRQARWYRRLWRKLARHGPEIDDMVYGGADGKFVTWDHVADVKALEASGKTGNVLRYRPGVGLPVPKGEEPE